MRSTGFICIWLVAISLAPHDAVAGDASAVKAGRRLAEINCEPCHAIGRTDRSTIAQAPPFRAFVATGRIAQLPSVLTDSSRMAHEEMPQTRFGQKDIDALTAYIERLADDVAP